MTDRSRQQPRVKVVTLPSGRQVEVQYFGELPREVSAHEGLHICRVCASDLVYPVQWHEHGPEHWEVELRCPNCEWTDTGVFSQQACDRFDEDLDRGTESVVRDLRRLIHHNFETDIERFAQALADGHILPEDF